MFDTSSSRSLCLHDTQANRITVIVYELIDYEQICKMHVYTLVWLKSDRIRFLIVELKHPDYSIDSRITPACIRSIRSDQILRSAQAQDFFPEAVSRK